MPNRILKESICRSDSIDQLTWFEEVVFYRLIVVCDDYGRFDGRPAVIRGACFPLKDIRLEQIENALHKLATAGMIWMYTAEERPYLQLTAWERHQQIRAQKSKFPASDIACNQLISSDSNGNQMHTYESNGNHEHADDSKCSRNPIQSESNTKTMCKAGADALFENLWKLYPSKRGKGQVSLAAKQRLLKVGYDEMVRAIDRYKTDLEKDKEWRRPQNGSTFFNSGYVDYLDQNYNPPQEEKSAEDPVSEEQEEEKLAGDDWWK